MRKVKSLFTGAAIVSFVFFANSALAMNGAGKLSRSENGIGHKWGISKGKRIEISHPERNQTVSGYFIPVSWRDASVEEQNLSYPENYEKSQKTYRVLLLDRNKVVLEKVVENLNYVVFTINEIKDVLEKKPYRLRIIDTESLSFSRPIRFFYDKPAMDDSILEELQKLSPSQEDVISTPEEEDGQFTSLDNAYAAVNTSSYTSCPTCYSHYWPGMVVFYVRYPTTYSKKLYIYCGASKYYEETFSPSFTGPVFTSMLSGYNYNAIYWDGMTLSNSCINIEPFEYTWVIFP
jgi:hypothetical protein